MKICGIYCWTNLLNNKKYIGASRDIYKRWKTHTQSVNDGVNRKFYNGVRKYGDENFSKEILEQINSKELDSFIKDREDYYIDFFDSINTGYNIEKGYNTITHHPDKKGIIALISQKAKNRKWINNGIENITCDIDKIDEYLSKGWQFGRLAFTDQHIEQLSNSHKGKKLSNKQKTAWCSGRPHSETTKKMMSNKLKGRYSLDWYINKYGESEGTKKHVNHHAKTNKNSLGKKCINNGVINKLVDEKDLDLYLFNNWIKGRLWKKKQK